MLKSLPVEWLQRGTYQPRETFDNELLRELAASIKSQGLIEPLVVRELNPQQYEIIAGERRWRAAQMAGLVEIPCVINNYTEVQAAAITLIENIQREDLNPIEEATGYQRLVTDFHFLQEEISLLVGKSRSHIANLLRLLTLCDAVQQQVRMRQLTLGHGRMLVGLSTEQQMSLAHKIKLHKWSVRRLEKEVKLLKQTAPSQSKQASQDVLRLQTYVSEQLGAPVEITSDLDQSGWLKIKFYDNDTLSGLLEKMGVCETDVV